MARLVAAVVLCGLLFGVARADDTLTYHNSNGTYAGKSVREGRMIRNYDANGAFIGHDEIGKNRIDHFDKDGRFLGYTKFP